MLIDLFATDNYGQYNIQIAKMWGLDVAVYLNEVLNINEKAIRKNKTSDCFFVLDRDYLTSRTTLTEKQQLEIEDKLENINILEKRETCTIHVDIVLLANLIGSEDEDLKKHVKKLVDLKSKKSKQTKRESIIQNLKSNIRTGNDKLDDYMSQWVDVICEKNGYMTKTAIEETQNKLISYSSPDLNKAYDIIKIAIINGHRDINWSIEKYEKDHAGEKNLTNFGQSVKILDTIKY